MKTHQAVLLAALSLMVPSIARAHCGMCGHGESKAEGKPSEAAAQDPMAMMSKELNLTEDQKTKIKAIKEEKHKAVDAAHKDAHAKIKAVLTKDQQAKFEKLHTEGKQGCDVCPHGSHAH